MATVVDLTCVTCCGLDLCHLLWTWLVSPVVDLACVTCCGLGLCHLLPAVVVDFSLLGMRSVPFS